MLTFVNFTESSVIWESSGSILIALHYTDALIEIAPAQIAIVMIAQQRFVLCVTSHHL